MKKNLLLFLLTISLSTLSLAFNYADYTSGKIMGMGGAYTGIANDGNALFYNPAGLAFVDSGLIGHFNGEFTLMVDDSVQSVLDDFKVHVWPMGKTAKHYEGFGATYFTSGMSFGAVMARDMLMNFRSDNNIFIDSTNKKMICMGVARTFGDNFALGLTAKAVQLESMHGIMPTGNLGPQFDGWTLNDGQYAVANGLAMNVGAMYKVDNFSFGASIEDILSTEMTWSAKSTVVSGNTPESPKAKYRLGMGYVTPYTLMAFDLANITDASNMTYHFGVQQRLLDIPFIEWLGGITARAGYMAGKANDLDVTGMTVGAEFRFLIAKLNLSIMKKKVSSAESTEYIAAGQIEF